MSHTEFEKFLKMDSKNIPSESLTEEMLHEAIQKVWGYNSPLDPWPPSHLAIYFSRMYRRRDESV